ncbi:CATG protein, partial [Menura novaehollandiae]|nr:CATG protein [Menura novaehollandiae]
AAYVILIFLISLPGRIIGGRNVPAHSRPYMAYLQIQNQAACYTCGGFLIGPDAVLSAAHCVDKKGTVKITVTLGAHDITKKESSQQKFHVGQWVIHPKYSNHTLENDIVLLKLKPKAKITKYVQNISLPRSNERVRPGTECNVSGWGWTSKTGNKTNVMREVKLKVQSEEKCQQEFPKYQCQSMICVGDEYLNKAPYSGDSGGPLVCNQKAHGIVSHGHKYRLFPEVFTRISYFERWIREQLRKFALQELPGSPS